MNALRLWLEVLVARGNGARLFAGVLFALVFAGLNWQQFDAARKLGEFEHARAGRVAGGAKAAPQTNLDRLSAFERTLGAGDKLDEHLRTMFNAAKKRGVVLARGEYRLIGDPAGGFVRYQILLPVRGNFRAINGFAEQVLLDLPFAALEDVAFRRETAGSGAVEARLRLVLFLQSADSSRTDAGLVLVPDKGALR